MPSPKNDKQQPFVFKFGADETTFAFRTAVAKSSSSGEVDDDDVELPGDVSGDANYEKVAAQAALSRASTHYL